MFCLADRFAILNGYECVYLKDEKWLESGSNSECVSGLDLLSYSLKVNIQRQTENLALLFKLDKCL